MHDNNDTRDGSKNYLVLIRYSQYSQSIELSENELGLVVMYIAKYKVTTKKVKKCIADILREERK